MPLPLCLRGAGVELGSAVSHCRCRLAVVFYGLLKHGQRVFGRGVPKDTVPGDKTWCVVLTAQEPPAIVEQFVICVPHKILAGALKAYPFAPPALLRMLWCKALISLYLVYLVVWDIHSGTVPDDSVQAYGAEVVLRPGSRHDRMPPVSRNTVIQPFPWGQDKGSCPDPRICVWPRVFWPSVGRYSRSLQYYGLTVLFLQYDPFYLGFLWPFHHPYSSTSHMLPHLGITWLDRTLYFRQVRDWCGLSVFLPCWTGGGERFFVQDKNNFESTNKSS